MVNYSFSQKSAAVMKFPNQKAINYPTFVGIVADYLTNNKDQEGKIFQKQLIP